MEPADLRRDDAPAECGQLVVATALVSEIRGGTSLGLDDEAVGEETLDDAVEIPRLEGDEPVGTLGDGLDQGVPMKLLLAEGEKELEVDGLERQEPARIGHGCLGMIKMIIRAE
jgi:hypothetical protein